MVTLNFTANGGDGYPIKANGENFRFLLADGTLSAPVDEALDFTAPANVPANALGEQAGVRRIHGRPSTARRTRPTTQADTPEAEDTRIQNLNVREDTVFEGSETGPDDGDNIIPGTRGRRRDCGLRRQRSGLRRGRRRSLDGNTATTISRAATATTPGGRNGGDAWGAMARVLSGGLATTQLDGGDGNDVMFGDAGNDTLQGGLGNDVVKGDAGDDMFVVTSLVDGRDIYDGGDGSIRWTSALSFSRSISPQGRHDDVLRATSIVNVENLIGGAAGDRLAGNGLDNVLAGAPARHPEGGGGDDGSTAARTTTRWTAAPMQRHSSGRPGRRYLKGGAGDDFIRGGEGADTWPAAPASTSSSSRRGEGIDTITDFKLSGASQRPLVLSA